MSEIMRLLIVSVITASLFAPLSVNAATPVKVTCSVVVDYLLNGVATESYQKAFAVDPGLTFNDDFSTVSRQKFFSASTALDAGNTVVNFSYFNDVGVQDAIDFNSKLTMRDKGRVEATSGSYTFTTTAGGTPQQAHTVNYTLSCKQPK